MRAAVATCDTGWLRANTCSHDGIVFEKDLGANTATAAAAMKMFDPDDSWHQDDELKK